MHFLPSPLIFGRIVPHGVPNLFKHGCSPATSARGKITWNGAKVLQWTRRCLPRFSENVQAYQIDFVYNNHIFLIFLQETINLVISVRVKNAGTWGITSPQRIVRISSVWTKKHGNFMNYLQHLKKVTVQNKFWGIKILTQIQWKWSRDFGAYLSTHSGVWYDEH